MQFVQPWNKPFVFNVGAVAKEDADVEQIGDEDERKAEVLWVKK